MWVGSRVQLVSISIFYLWTLITEITYFFSAAFECLHHCTVYFTIWRKFPKLFKKFKFALPCFLWKIRNWLLTCNNFYNSKQQEFHKAEIWLQRYGCSNLSDKKSALFGSLLAHQLATVLQAEKKSYCYQYCLFLSKKMILYLVFFSSELCSTYTQPHGQQSSDMFSQSACLIVYFLFIVNLQLTHLKLLKTFFLHALDISQEIWL